MTVHSVQMVTHAELRTHQLLDEYIGNFFAEILSDWEKAECYEDSQSIFTLIKEYILWGFSDIYDITHWKIENDYFE